MITCAELENLRSSWKGEVCIFGAGQIGKGTAYEVIKTAGFHVDFYCDNYVPTGTYVKDDLIVKDIQYLYEHKDDILVFLCVSAQYQKQILEQLGNHNIKDIVILDASDCYISQIMEEVDKADDETKKRWHAFYDDVEFLSKVFKKQMGYDLNIENPKTYHEKLQWLKLYDRNPAYTQMVDKYAVKKYIEEKVGKEYVVPTLGVYDTFDDIEFEKLPEQFVLKCTHDSGSIVKCRDKNCFDKEKAREILERRLHINYYWSGREWSYKNVKPRIIAEKYLEDDIDEELRDYKFFMFNGEMKCMFIVTDRNKGFEETRYDFYDEEFNHLNLTCLHPNATVPPHKPKKYEEMCELAQKLSKDIPHVRVDFYEVNGQVYFGEMTFYHDSGWVHFEPHKWDRIFGDWIDLDIRKENLSDKILGV